jgi:hypothetical protein
MRDSALFPVDYFPEFREGVVIDRVKHDPKLRDRLYKQFASKTETSR